MAILDLFIASLMPVLEVLLVTAVGSFLALERVNLLGSDARKYLNDVVFFVFSPALVGSNLAKYITDKSVAHLWFMPLNVLMTFIIGSLLGWLVIKITCTPRNLQGLVLGCCAAGNLGNLPFILIPAICQEKGSPFGVIGNCQAKGLAYVSLSMALGAVYMWAYVYNLLRAYASNVPQRSEIRAASKDQESAEENQGKCPISLKELAENDNHVDHVELDCPISAEKRKVPVLEKIKSVWHKLNLERFLAPSTIAAIIGFTVGIIPPFRKLLIGDTAPLRVFQESTSLLGNAAIPTITLIMGANLLKGLKGPRVPARVVIGIIVVRYMLLPSVGIGIVKLAERLGMVHSDSLYKLVLMLQYSLPPAMNIATMTQLFGAGESECSAIMLFTYALASVAMTLWSTLFMWLVG